ncbi:MAG: ATP-dependent DNA ligase [Candidatus Diapherotrites archaeon]
MEFKIVAEAFEKIEAVPSRLEMTALLSQLLGIPPADEIADIVYLCQGTLAPAFMQVNVGMGEKFVAEAISKVSGFSRVEIDKLFKEKGDLGLVAAEVLGKKKQLALYSERLSVKKVHGNLMKIASSSGTGSQESKIRLLAELLNSASPVEAKFIVRIPLENLRLGIGDPTIMDALAVNYINEFRKTEKKEVERIEKNLKEKKPEKRKEELERRLRIRLREMIEEKYNIHSDLGAIASVLKEKGLKGIESIGIEPGIPIRPTLAERLPSVQEIVEKLGECAVESKYDGFRCISGAASIYVERKGFTQISNVRIGDRVLTHKGEFKKVIAKNKRTIDKGERLFRIQTYFGDKFKITEKHPVLVNRNKKLAWVNVEKLQKTDYLVFPLPKMTYKEKRLMALELETIDCYKKRIVLDNSFFRFIGYWIGDGFTNSFHNTERIGLIFNEKTEKRLCSYYESLVKELFGLKKISKNTHNGAIYLYWRDSPFKKWLTQNFRREWKGKMLPNWFFNISKREFSEFLRGWIESDGTIDKQGRIAITTKEKDLAMFAQLLGLKFKKLIGVKKVKVKLKKYDWTYYKLVIPKSEIKAKIVDGNVLVKILRLEEFKYPDPRTRLYNLQVEGHESYCATMLAMHNCQIHKNAGNVTIFSRHSEPMTEMFPEIVSAVKKQVKANNAIFEGEALAVNEETGEFLPFQVTIQRKRKYDVKQMAKDFPLKLFAFDLMYADGKNYMKEPFRKRRDALAKIIGKGETIKMTETIVTKDAEKIDSFFNECIERGLEGIIAKDLNAPYIAGARKFSWIKLKRSYKGELSDSVDAVILGFFKGKGQRVHFGLGALLSGVYDKESDSFKTIAKVGSGLKEEGMAALEKQLQKIKVKEKPARVDSELKPDVWVEPEFVAEIRADEITRSPIHTAGKGKGEDGFALRFPRFIKLRSDKKAEEATTVKEIRQMYKNQKHLQLSEGK